MRVPQTPPDWNSVFFLDDPEAAVAALRILGQPQVEEFIRAANDRYLHWDKLRFQPLPDGVTPAMAWSAIQFNRRPQHQRLAIQSYRKGQLKYWLPPQHQEWLSIIDQKAGGNIGARQAQPIRDDDKRYLFNSLMEEAIASSQLEGACTTRSVGKKLLRSGRQPRDKSERMILNNFKAITEIREVRNESLTPALLCHLQEVLTDKTLDNPDGAGRFRRVNEDIHVADVTTGEAIFTPPPAESVEERVRQICDFANTKSSPFVHPVVKAMALHFAIGFVHPFVDGNGRTARALFYWYMLKNDYWLFEYLPISRIIIAAPARYARAYLYTETDSYDLTYFNHYHLRVVIRAIEHLHDYLERRQREMAEAERLLHGFPDINHRQRDIVRRALKHPAERYTAQEYEGTYRVTANTARADLQGLEQMGLFVKSKRPGGGKGWLFRPAPDLMKRLKQPAARPRRPQETAQKETKNRKKPAKRKRVERQQASLFDFIAPSEATPPRSGDD